MAALDPADYSDDVEAETTGVAVNRAFSTREERVRVEVSVAVEGERGHGRGGRGKHDEIVTRWNRVMAMITGTAHACIWWLLSGCRR